MSFNLLKLLCIFVSGKHGDNNVLVNSKKEQKRVANYKTDYLYRQGNYFNFRNQHCKYLRN